MAEDKFKDFGSIGPIPENRVLGPAARGLAALKRGLGHVPLPEVLGGDLGNLVVGSAPEEVDKWAHGFSPFYDQSGGFNPTLRPDRYQGVLDAALLPVGEAVGLTKLAGKGVKKGIATLAGDVTKTGAEDEARRTFLKGTAGTAGAAAAAKILPKVLEKDAAKAVEKGTMFDYIDAIKNAEHDAYETMNALEHNAFETMNPLPSSTGSRKAIRDRILQEKLAKLAKDPRFTPAQRRAYEEYTKAFEGRMNGLKGNAPDEPRRAAQVKEFLDEGKRVDAAKRKLGWVPPEEVYGKVMKEGEYQNPLTGERFVRDGDRVRYHYPPHEQSKEGIRTKPLDEYEVEHYAGPRGGIDSEHGARHEFAKQRWYGEDYRDIPHGEMRKPSRFDPDNEVSVAQWQRYNELKAEREAAKKARTEFHLNKFAKEHPRLHKALTDFSQGWGTNYKAGGSIENTTHDRKLI